MSNHARGLWGYSGRTPSGLELTVQATGMGGPSAAVVLADLAKLGVRRAVRVGTCTDVAGRTELAELLLADGVVAAGGSATAFGLAPGATVAPDAELLARLQDALVGEARSVTVASLDVAAAEADQLPKAVAAADMQTATLFARSTQLGIAAAAILIVDQAGDERLGDERLETAARLAGNAAVKSLSR